METFEKLEAVIASAKDDAVKFHEKGNRAAGTRLRKALMEVKNLSHEYRKEIAAASK